MDNLKETAELAKNRAYAPYSNFHVGCALETDTGKVYAGCNIENKSFSLTNCAERSAIFSAISDGHKSFSRMVLSSDDAHFISPCGACLQVMSEFMEADFPIVIMNNQKEEKLTSMGDLLPDPFVPNSNLGKA